MIQEKKNEIFVSFLLTEEYLTTILKLHCSLQKVKSTRPLVVFYFQGAISNKSILRLKSSGIETKPIEPLKYPNYMIKRFSINWTKLRLWTMEQYSKIVFLDGDMFVLENIDHLFDIPTPFAIPVDTDRQHLSKCSPMGMNQAGLFVMTPCKSIFENMIFQIENNQSLQFQNSDAEQGFFNYYFQFVRFLLPLDYNFLAHRHWNSHLRTHAKVLHYTTYKPFHEGGPIFDYHQPWLECQI